MNLSDRLTHPIFSTIGEVAATEQLETYVVGGFVRDLLLNRASKDIDFVCVGSGMDLAKATAKTNRIPCTCQLFQKFRHSTIPFG